MEAKIHISILLTPYNICTIIQTLFWVNIFGQHSFPESHEEGQKSHWRNHLSSESSLTCYSASPLIPPTAQRDIWLDVTAKITRWVLVKNKHNRGSQRRDINTRAQLTRSRSALHLLNARVTKHDTMTAYVDDGQGKCHGPVTHFCNFAVDTR